MAVAVVVVAKPTIASCGTELRWRLLLREEKVEMEEEEAGRGRGTGGVEMSFRAVVLSGERGGNWRLLSRRTSIVKDAALSPCSNRRLRDEDVMVPNN